MIPLGIMALLLGVGLFMLWSGSFRRNLDDATLEKYLRPDASDMETHHAMEELSRRAQRDEESRKRFYPAVIALASSPSAPKRQTVAWAMGEDPKEPAFREALEKLVGDPDPRVAHNAALALAVHRSDAGRPVLLAMLKPATVTAPEDGILRPRVKVGETPALQSEIAVIETPRGKLPVQPPVPGRVLSIGADGARVARGETIATLAAAQSHAYQALRALTIPGIGRPEDAAVIASFLEATPDLEKQVREQANRALRAVSGR
jgi:hypothetical protein